MAVSPAKLEANRRNAQKSTGPRTQEGKDRSKMNATTHGCRAETLVLPEEDSLELEARRAAWTASLGPCSELEQHAVDQAVHYSWRQDRARRAEARRAHARLEELSDEEPAATAEREAVLDLGRRLFTDRMGPLRFYPATFDECIENLPRKVSTSFPRKDDKSPISRRCSSCACSPHSKDASGCSRSGPNSRTRSTPANRGCRRQTQGRPAPGPAAV